MLTLTADQVATLQGLDPLLETVFAEGAGVSTPTVSAMDRYDGLNANARQAVREVFIKVLAAVLAELNLEKPLAAVKFNGVLPLAAVTPSGAAGSITIQDGLVIAVSSPT